MTSPTAHRRASLGTRRSVTVGPAASSSAPLSASWSAAASVVTSPSTPLAARVTSPGATAFAPAPASCASATSKAGQGSSEVRAVRRVFVTENEANFLALPPADDAMVVVGAGSGLEHVATVPWLASPAVHYRGDIDTHGFAISDQLRRRCLTPPLFSWTTKPSCVTSVTGVARNARSRGLAQSHRARDSRLRRAPRQPHSAEPSPRTGTGALWGGQADRGSPRLRVVGSGLCVDKCTRAGRPRSRRLRTAR
jgi:hypothetical protein